MSELVNPQKLDQHDEDADSEVEIVRRIGTHRSWQRKPSLAADQHQRPLSLQDEIRDPAMTTGDQQAKKKSRKFE